MADNNRVDIIVALKDATKSGLSSINAGMDKLRSMSGTVAKSVVNLRNSLAGLGAGIALGDVTKTFADFDDKMREVSAVSRAVPADIERLTAVAKEMGATTRFSASEAADGLKFLSMAGLDASQSIEALPGTLNLAAAANLELGEAADIVTNALSGMQLPVSELPRVSDAMAYASTRANTSVRELGEAFKIAGPAAKGSGQSLEEVTAVLGGLANNGIKGGEAGNAVKRMLLALQNPTKKARDALERLNVQTLDSAGNFRGIIPVMRDLGKANLSLADSSKIFGLYSATAGVAAAGASKQIAQLNVELQDAGGTTDRMAKLMEAGLGGAIRSLKSAWEGLKITIGDGFGDAANKAIRFFTKELRGVIDAVKKLKADGSIDTWANAFISAIKDTYSNLKAMAVTVGTVASALTPLWNLLLGITPDAIALGVAALGINKSLGAMSAALNLAGGSLNLFFKGVQGLQVALPIIRAGIAATTTAMGGLGIAAAGLAAAWGVYKIIEATKALYDWRKAAAEAKVHSEGLLESTKKTQEQFSLFADVEMPADFAKKPKAELEALNAELRKSKAYWTAVYFEEQKLSEQTGVVSSRFREAKDRLAELDVAIGQTRDAITKYGSASETALKQATEAHDAHLKNMLNMRDQHIAAIKAGTEKQVADEFALYQKGEVDYATYMANKKAIEESGQQEIHNVRLDWAGRISEIIAQETQLLEQKKQIAIQKINEQAEAEAISRQAAIAQIEEVEKQHAEAVKSIQTNAAKAVTNEQKAILKERADAYIASLDSETEAMKSAYERRIQEIENAEARGEISHNKAIEKKLQAEINYHMQAVQAANDGMQKVKQVYASDTDQFKAAIDAKKAALDGLLQKEIDINNQIKSLDENLANSRKSTEELLRDIKRKTMSEEEKYADKRREIAERASKAEKLAQTDRQAAIKEYEALKRESASMAMAVTEGGKEVVSLNEGVRQSTKEIESFDAKIKELYASEKATLESARNEITGHSKTIADSLEKDRQALKSLMSDLRNIEPVTIEADGSLAIGEVNRVNDALTSIEASTIQLNVDTSAAEKKIARIRSELAKLQASKSKSEHTTEFKGKASPTKPLSETIKDVKGKISDLDAQIEKPTEKTVAMKDDSGKSITESINKNSEAFKQFAEEETVYFASMSNAADTAISVLDRSKKSLVDAVDYTSTASAEMKEQITTGWGGGIEALTDESIKSMAYMTEKIIEEAKASGQGFNSEISEMQSSVDVFYKALEDREAFEIKSDPEPAKESYKEIQAAEKETRTTAETPITPKIDISPAKQAMRELATEAYKNAVANEKLARQIWDDLQRAQTDVAYATSGDLQRIMHANYVNAKKEARKFTNEWAKYKGALEEPSEIKVKTQEANKKIEKTGRKIDDLKKKVSEGAEFNINLTGTGSPTKPIFTKLKDVGAALSEFASSIPQAAMDLDMSSFRNIPKAIQSQMEISPDIQDQIPTPKLENPMSNFKDYGKVQLVSPDGNTHEFISQGMTIESFTKSLRRERLTTS